MHSTLIKVSCVLLLLLAVSTLLWGADGVCVCLCFFCQIKACVNSIIMLHRRHNVVFYEEDLGTLAAEWEHTLRCSYYTHRKKAECVAMQRTGNMIACLLKKRSEKESYFLNLSTLFCFKGVSIVYACVCIKCITLQQKNIRISCLVTVGENTQDCFFFQLYFYKFHFSPSPYEMYTKNHRHGKSDSFDRKYRTLVLEIHYPYVIKIKSIWLYLKLATTNTPPLRWSVLWYIFNFLLISLHFISITYVHLIKNVKGGWKKYYKFSTTYIK